MSYQKLIVVGRLGGDPSVRFTPSGAQVTSFSVATDRKYKGSDGEQISETTWFRVTTWNKLAEVCAEYLKKGSEVLVEGTLSPDKETGGPKVFQRQDGTSGASYEVRADAVRFVGGKPQGASQERPQADEEEGIPF